MRNPVRPARLFALAVVLVGLSAAAAQAQSYKGRFTLPHEARWNGATLPAGDYSLAMSTIQGPLRVIDSSGQTRVLTHALVEDLGDGQPAALLVTRDGAVRTVRSLNCPAWGHKLVFKPFTRAERALIAAGQQTEAVPVRMASR